jgi:hypothetical protein
MVAMPNRTRERVTIAFKESSGEKRMTYVFTQPCIGVKDGSCVDVCAVDCIHPAEGVEHVCFEHLARAQREVIISGARDKGGQVFHLCHWHKFHP